MPTGRRIGKVRFAPLFPLLLLLSLAPAPAAAQRTELLAEAQAQGSVRVIVKLAAPWFVGEGDLRGNPGWVTQQRSDIVRLQDAALAALSAASHRVLWRYQTSPYVALEVTPAALTALASSPLVETVSRDVQLSTKLAGSGPIVEAPQVHLTGITGAGFDVVVIDTGIERGHPFLGGRVAVEFCVVSSPGGCPNGPTGPGAASPIGGHGTHVAGIAAGSGTSFSGMAPGSTIVAIRVASPMGSISLADVKAAMDRVVTLRNTRRIAAVNMSLGTDDLFSSACDAEDGPLGLKPDIDALRAVGIATVVATGNDGDANGVSYPACVSSAIKVGATTKTDVIASYSNLAPALEGSTLLAPGGSGGTGGTGQICSSLLSSSFASCSNAGTGGVFGTLSGTSMATPHVAGAWALLKQVKPEASVDEVLAALRSTGQPITDPSMGTTYRRIRIGAAATALSSGTIPPPPPPGDATATVTTNQVDYRPGDVLAMGVALSTGSTAAEIYVGFLLPDEQTVAFLGENGAVTGLANGGSPLRFIPWVAKPPGSALHVPEFFRVTFPQNWNVFGRFVAFILLVRPGSLLDNSVDPADILAIDSKQFTVSP